VETISLPARIMASPAQEEAVLVAYAACVCAQQHCCVLDGDYCRLTCHHSLPVKGLRCRILYTLVIGGFMS